MKRLYVQSQALRSVGHYGRTLEIEFNTGHVYRYHPVPLRVFSQLMDAPSKGQFFDYCIRDHYAFQKVK